VAEHALAQETMRARLLWLTAFRVSLLSALIAPVAQACDQPAAVGEATAEEIRAFFASKGMRVLTFLGYSGAEYENKGAMLAQAGRTLDEYDPATTIANIGATPEGIGAVYEIAKAKGFQTTGIVSTQARESGAKLSPCVDTVFYVSDATWGGFVSGSERLSPTSQAIIDSSDVIVAIGGGEVARDELIAAQRSGKEVAFVPADMNHEIARGKARKKGQPAPTDFRGAAGAVFRDTETPR
jgi:hypothetical protein